MSLNECVRWKTQWAVAKFKDERGIIAEMLRGGARVEDVVALFPEHFLGSEQFEGNVALNEGLQAIIDMIAGLATVTPWDSANARVGVGDSNTAEDPSQTGLLGTNQLYKAMDTGYPSRTNQTCEWRATFGPDDANFHWYEYTVDNGATAGINLNRKVADKGVKASGETWMLSVKITFS
jgi:hypothetical protein